MPLSNILKNYGRSINSITKIYHGKDNWCRCGCGGKYFYPGDNGFTRAINSLNKSTFTFIEIEAPTGCSFINISYDDSTSAGKCYCIYFD